MISLRNLDKKIETRPMTTETISPRKFIKVYESQPGSIKRAKFIRPALGEKHFGKFNVTYKYPTFKPIERKG